jgi:hypothetical protein
MKKNTKKMFNTLQIITILASSAVGSYAMDEREFIYAPYAGVLSESHNIETYQEEHTQKLKTKKKKLIPARFTSPNSKAKSNQERAVRYQSRTKNKENIHYENGCSPFNTAKIAQKPLTTQQSLTPILELKNKLPVFDWSHMPQSYTPDFDLINFDHSLLDELPEWEDIKENF